MPKSVAWGIGILVFAILLMGNQGFRRLWINFHERQRLERHLKQLQSENGVLRQELIRIQKDPSYTEFLIRKYLKYGLKDDVEYRLLKAKEDS